MLPLPSPGSASPVRSPKPKRRAARIIPSRPSRWATLAAPMFEDSARMRARVSIPWGWVSWMTCRPTSQLPPSQSKASSGRTARSSSAAAATKAL